MRSLDENLQRDFPFVFFIGIGLAGAADIFQNKVREDFLEFFGVMNRNNTKNTYWPTNRRQKALRILLVRVGSCDVHVVVVVVVVVVYGPVIFPSMPFAYVACNPIARPSRVLVLPI